MTFQFTILLASLQTARLEPGTYSISEFELREGGLFVFAVPVWTTLEGVFHFVPDMQQFFSSTKIRGIDEIR